MRNLDKTTNQGLQRLVESYSPRISEYEVLDFLKKKGFDPSSQITKNFASAVTEYLSYPENDDYDLKSWYKDTLMNYPEDLRYLPKLKEAFSPSRFSETLDDSDYQDFLHSLSEVVTKESKKWKNRGISISDVCHALDELGVRFEDLSDEDINESLSSRDETKVRILLNKRIPRSDVVEDIIDVINQSPLNTTKDKLRLEKRVRDIYPVDDWAMENIILAYALLNK